MSWDYHWDPATGKQEPSGSSYSAGDGVNNEFADPNDGTRLASLTVKSELVTLDTTGATTDVNNFFPIGAVPLSIAVKVTTAIGNNGYITTTQSFGWAHVKGKVKV